MSQVTFVMPYLISRVGEQPMSVPAEPLWRRRTRRYRGVSPCNLRLTRLARSPFHHESEYA